MRLLQFLGSHFNATRLGSPHTEKVFIRLLNVTLGGLKHSTGHPLAREIRFQIVLFGLKVLRHSIGLDFGTRCLLKDRILSSALNWFSFPPRWSFGGNRLQLKAETRLLADVSIALRNVQIVADKPAALMKSMQAKESLLQALIESELSRLAVWLYPLSDPREGYLSNQGGKGPAEVFIAALMPQAFLTRLGRSRWTREDSMGGKSVSCCTTSCQVSFSATA
jgi:phosphatidylinositol 4-kinase